MKLLKNLLSLIAYLLYLNIEYNRKVFGINLVENNKALLEEKNINNLFIDI